VSFEFTTFKFIFLHGQSSCGIYLRLRQYKVNTLLSEVSLQRTSNKCMKSFIIY